jgi:hypothetical protein
MQIERRIVIDHIVSTDYLRRIQKLYNPKFLEDPIAKKITGWCWEYFEKYNKAPGKDIESIFYQKVQDDLPKDVAEEIEEDILPGLSDEYEREDTFNLEYSLDRAYDYFAKRHLEIHNQEVVELTEDGKVQEAEKLINAFIPLQTTTTTGLDLSAPSILDIIETSFASTKQYLVRYPKQLGEFWNAQFIRGGFLALMASEKRGKTFWLMDIALRSYGQKFKVAFFQAGDMTEEQQLRRIYTYVSQKNELKKYSGKMWVPVKDCVFNQLNNRDFHCDRKEREGDVGVVEFKTKNTQYLREDVTQEELITAYTNDANEEYRACYNCKEYEVNRWGTTWIEEIDAGDPLTVDEAKKAMEDFFVKGKRTFKLSTHANGTLSVLGIERTLDEWEQQDNFVPDVVVIDYADLLVPEVKLEYRHQQNDIWKKLRGLSQKKHCLVVTATQADADSYDRTRLSLKNFSEDKRKYAHVTAMYGLNQDPKGREKQLGLMRINEIVIREGDSNVANEVYILQNLKRGRPFIGSFW